MIAKRRSKVLLPAAFHYALFVFLSVYLYTDHPIIIRIIPYFCPYPDFFSILAAASIYSIHLTRLMEQLFQIDNIDSILHAEYYLS